MATDGRSIILDSTAVLALFFEEEGADNVLPHLATGGISTVNVTEVVTVALRKGASLGVVQEFLFGLGLEVVPYDTTQAVLAGSLQLHARKFNLSLADRACLGVGLALGLPVLTADHTWVNVPIGVEVRVFREAEVVGAGLTGEGGA